MIATANVNTGSTPNRLGFEHLLLGDLRELLNDTQGRERDRWLIATLDMLLVTRPRGALVYLPVIPREDDLSTRQSTFADFPIAYEKLQRLRDRIAHRAPYEALAQELNLDLQSYFARPLMVRV